MKKPLKVLSATALASVMMAGTLVPVAAAATPEQNNQYKIENIVFKDGENLAYLSVADYNMSVALNEVNDTVAYVTYPDGSTYPLEDYNMSYVLSETAEDVKKDLEENSQAVEDKIYEGYIDDNGKVRAKVDEQPEDRLNETFFYNVA